MSDENLLFVVSQPRSGSTLCQALLSNNNSVATVSEPWLMLPICNILNSKLSRSCYNEKLASAGIEDFVSKIGGHVELLDALRALSYRLYGKLHNGKVKYVLDKTPRYYEILTELRVLFPNSKILVLVRNPLSVLNSIIDTWVRVEDSKALFSYNRDLLAAPKLMKSFLDAESSNPNTRYVRYEDLIVGEKTLESLYNWLGLTYSDSNLNYSSNSKYKGRMGDPKGIQKHSRPSADSLDLWKLKIDNKYWGAFFQGYASYSMPYYSNFYPNLSDYARKSQMFDRYIGCISNSLHDFRGSKKLALKFWLQDYFL